MTQGAEARREMDAIALDVIPRYGYRRRGSRFDRWINEVHVVFDLPKSRFDNSFTLEVGVLFQRATDDRPRTIKTLRPPECHAAVRVLSAPLDDALNWDHDMTIADRRALFDQEFVAVAEPIVHKLTDVDFLRSNAGREFMRGRAVDLVGQRFLGWA